MFDDGVGVVGGAGEIGAPELEGVEARLLDVDHARDDKVAVRLARNGTQVGEAGGHVEAVHQLRLGLRVAGVYCVHLGLVEPGAKNAAIGPGGEAFKP